MRPLASSIATLLVVASFALLALEPAGQFARHGNDTASPRTVHASERQPRQHSAARVLVDSPRLAASPTPLPLEAQPNPTPHPPTPTAVRDSASRVPTSHRPAPPETVSRFPSAGGHVVIPSATAEPTATRIVPPRANVQWLPITRLQIPSINLVAEVVPAPLIESGGEKTWQVPSFKVGHGQFTAGAGQVGTAVLLGHVESRHDGSIFRDLHRVRVGDTIRVFSREQRFEYRVVQVRIVSPDDLSVLRPTGRASVVLITCAGEWAPSLNDYTRRLVVRADLVAPQN